MIRKRSNSEIEKILIIRLSSIGDIILTTPAVRLIKKRFPRSELDFVVKKQFAELVAHHPAIHHLYFFDKNNDDFSLKKIKRQIVSERYDLIIDLHKNFRSFYLTTFSRARRVVRYSKFSLRRSIFVKFKINLFKKVVPIHQRYLLPLLQFSISDDGEGLEIYFSPTIKSEIEKKYELFFEQNFEKIIAIAPGASFATKRWLPEYFQLVISHFAEDKKNGIILIGNQQDRELIDSLNIKAYRNVLVAAGELSLLGTAALMDKCQLVITNDSGLMHLATALKKKIVAIFGSTTRELGFFPVTKDAVILENNQLSCRPCSHVGRDRCPKKHFQCMAEIQPRQVIEAVESVSSL
ncbi:MAG: glycosyltransferase family 9 protein [Calditrichaeota bacterium]|nr:glycosyltransferase family 9 protein [Calditrichota bacterium]